MHNISDMKIETTLSNEQFQLFELLGVNIDNEYFHLPQYFKSLGAGEFEVINLEDLPEHIKEFTPNYECLKNAEGFLNDCDIIVAGDVYTESGYNTMNVDAAIKIASGLD